MSASAKSWSKSADSDDCYQEGPAACASGLLTIWAFRTQWRLIRAKIATQPKVVSRMSFSQELSNCWCGGGDFFWGWGLLGTSWHLTRQTRWTAPTTATSFPPGTTLFHGQYRITRFINSGGFGITYLAKDSLDRDVVIKECFSSTFCRRTQTRVRARSLGTRDHMSKIVKCFLNEARSLATLSIRTLSACIRCSRKTTPPTWHWTTSAAMTCRRSSTKRRPC